LVSTDPKRYSGPADGEFDEATLLRFELGLAWEEVALSQAYLRRVSGVSLGIHPKELLTQQGITRDGISMTPDAVHMLGGVPQRILEAKWTRISAANSLSGPRFRHWRWQAASYCRAYGVHEAIFLVVFLDGDYRPRVLKPTAWRMVWTPEELNANWRMILNARGDLVKGRGKR
jgi:hypothetical protein